MAGYVPRIIDSELADALASHSAVMITGARATGKTTTANQHATNIIRLDRPREAAAFAADPDGALARQNEPVLLDEWQVVPEVLGAVKRAVDSDPRPGRFLLTGSVRADLDTAMWPGTGRVIRYSMYGLNQREVTTWASTPSPFESIAAGKGLDLVLPSAMPDLPGYLDLALRGGLPNAVLAGDDRAARRWLTSYLGQILTGDTVEISTRDPARLARYFEVLALNTAGVANDASLNEAAGIDRKTALSYERLLIDLFMLDIVPAWFTNRLARLIKTPKRYIMDPALVGTALRLDTAGVLRDADLIGRLLDTFVMAQIRPELGATRRMPRLYHFRERNGRHEIDLIGEFAGDCVVAIEVKATAAPGRTDAVHLSWLRDRLGNRFLAGILLHTGQAAFPLGDRIAALPIAALWSAG